MLDYSNRKKTVGERTRVYDALTNTLLTILQTNSFSKITVNDLCKVAGVSRSTFYVYFSDKFDLLECCMNDLKARFEELKKEHTEKKIMEDINNYFIKHARLLKNLLDDNNAEVMGLLLKVLTPSLSGILSPQEKKDEKMTLAHEVLANFCAGGIVNLLLWQVQNNFPVDKKLMSSYLYRMQRGIEMLDLEQPLEEHIEQAPR